LADYSGLLRIAGRKKRVELLREFHSLWKRIVNAKSLVWMIEDRGDEVKSRWHRR
jgi:hypothetical protein